MTTLQPEALAFELQLTSRICDVIGSERAKLVKTLISEERWVELVSLDIDPSEYEDPGAFADDYLVTKILSKSVNVPTGIDTAQVCLDSFHESERHCTLSSQRIMDRVQNLEWFQRFRSEVGYMLGELTPERLNGIIPKCRNGGGVVVGVSGDGLVPSDKYDRIPTVTPDLLPFAYTIMGDSHKEYRPQVSVVNGGRFFMVPKNAKTDRGCATETSEGQKLQQGIGRELREVLRKFGVDIRDQTRNRRMARTAKTAGRVTIDLKTASDLICIGLIVCGFPYRWAHLLSLARSPMLEVPVCSGSKDYMWVDLQKFCTMGNGFTFPLQSLIFLALARVTVPAALWDEISVYGDDIIVPVEFSDQYIRRLEALGFKVNHKKSCLAGRFFESCGHDYFDEVNVRPFYLHQEPGNPIPYPVAAANGLRLWCQRRLFGGGCDIRFKDIWQWIYDQAPRAWQTCRVPPSLGNQGFLSTREEWLTLLDSMDRKPSWGRDGWEGDAVRRIGVEPSEVVDKRSYGVLLNALAHNERRPAAPKRFDHLASAKDGGQYSFVYLKLVPPKRGCSGPPNLVANTTGVSRGVEICRGYLRLARPSKALVLLKHWDQGLAWL